LHLESELFAKAREQFVDPFVTVVQRYLDAEAFPDGLRCRLQLIVSRLGSLTDEERQAGRRVSVRTQLERMRLPTYLQLQWVHDVLHRYAITVGVSQNGVRRVVERLGSFTMAMFDFYHEHDDPSLGPDCHFSLWRRDPTLDAGLGSIANPIRADDLSMQVMQLRAPNGLPLSAMAFRLTWHHITGERWLLGHRLYSLAYPYGWFESQLIDMSVLLMSADEDDVQVQRYSATDRVHTYPPTSLYPYIPITTMPGSVLHPATAQIMADSHASLYDGGTAGYEALRHVEADKRRLVLDPGASTRIAEVLGSDADTLLAREIVPTPHQLPLNDFASLVWVHNADTGRSVTYDLGDDGVEYRGGRWFALSAIGVGHTQQCRVGEEFRDGQTHMQRARRRLYATWLLHSIGHAHGLRVPTVIGVMNRGHARGKAPVDSASVYAAAYEVSSSLSAIVYVLRRSPWRLDALYGNEEIVHERLAHVMRRLAVELGSSFGAVGDYVEWLMQTIGRQLGLLTFFRVDHGLDDGFSQLYPANGSLAGSICDWETVAFNASSTALAQRYRLVASASSGEAHINLARIAAMQEHAMGWVGALQQLAPNVSLASAAQSAYDSTIAALTTLGINPREEIARFNSDVWRPWIKQHRAELLWRPS
jgi:hypothetical protein